jgi:hypothetical protein
MVQQTLLTTVNAIQGNPVAAGTPPVGATLVWNGTAWVPQLPTPLGVGNIGRNYVHNSMFNVQQRGQGPWTTNGDYLADRWQFFSINDTVSCSIYAMTDADRAAISDEDAISGLQYVFAGSATAGSYSCLQHKTEFVHRLSNKAVIVSFWAKAVAGAPEIGVSIGQFFGFTGSPSPSTQTALGTTPALSSTWTRYSFTGTFPSTAGKTLGTDGMNFSSVSLFGSDQANQFDTGIGVQSGTVVIWGVQVEVVQADQTAPTPLEKPDPRYDLSNCQRFYTTFPNINISSNAVGNAFANLLWPVAMRATPTVTIGYTNYQGAQDGNVNYVDNVMVTMAASITAATGYAVLGIDVSADL